MTRYIKRHIPRLCCAAVLVAATASSANAQASAAKVHVDAAQAAVAAAPKTPNAALHTFKALFDQACAQPMLPDQMRTNDRSAVVPRKDWFAFPANVFDNLYFIGTKTAGVWAVNTPEGVILIDANFHYSSKELVMGLLNFGIAPESIKYVLITHAHDDRYWGAKALQDTYPNARIGMSAADWDLVAKDNSPAQFKPKKDLVIADGQKFTLGDVTVTAYVTPGHTPGTLSFIIEPLWNKKSIASDEGRHVAAIWGGTDPSIGRQGVQYYPDGQAMMRTHVASLRRFIDLGKKAGVDTILTPTLAHGNMVEKLRQWRIRNPDHSAIAEVSVKFEGEPHPFVSTEAVDRFNKVLLECYEAQLAWRTGS
jgi:metallo-beta-lactamase class B